MNIIFRKQLIWCLKLGDICEFQVLFANFQLYLRISNVICVFRNLLANFKVYLRFPKITQSTHTKTPKQLATNECTSGLKQNSYCVDEFKFASV